jgi:hypothetical protein
MWQQLQCNYFVELILCIASDTIIELQITTTDLSARKSNLQYSVSTLEVLITDYIDEKLIPYDYISLYSPLIDLKVVVDKISPSLDPYERIELSDRLQSLSSRLATAYDKIAQASVAI